jgi:hypothetical protein
LSGGARSRAISLKNFLVFGHLQVASAAFLTIECLLTYVLLQEDWFMPKLDRAKLNELPINEILEFYLKDLKDSLMEVYRSFSNFMIDEKISLMSSIQDAQDKVSFLSAFLNAQDKIKNANANTHNILLSAALDAFAQGVTVFLHNALVQFKKEHDDLFLGCNITYDRILKCALDVEQILTESEKNANILGDDFDLLSQYIQKADKELTFGDNEAQKKVLGSITYRFQEIKDSLNNRAVVLWAIKAKFIQVIGCEMVVVANKSGVDFHQIFDQQTFCKQVRAIKELSQGLLFLDMNSSNTNEMLFDYYLEYRATAEFSKEIDALHPAVKRGRYLSQGLAVENRIARGFCLGGVRYWGGKPVILEATEPFAKHHELNAFEVNAEIIKLQKKQLKNLEFNSADDYVEYPVKTVKMIDSEEDLQDETVFIGKVNAGLESLIDSVLELAKNHHYEATMIVGFDGPIQAGHAVGFKVIERDERLFVVFFDYNSGEFFTDDLTALKDWMKAYCLRLGYSKKYFGYELCVMMPQKPLLSNLLRETFSMLNVKAENNLRQCSSALLVAYNAAQKSMTVGEMHDENLRSRINQLLPYILEDEDTVATALEILKLHRTISEKNAEDYGNIFFCCISVIDETNDASVALELLKMASEVTGHLIKLDSSNESLQIGLSIKKVNYGVHYGQEILKLDNQGELDIFFKKVALLTEANVLVADNLPIFKKLTRELGEVIRGQNSFNLAGVVTEKIAVINDFIMNEWYLWVSEPISRIFDKIMSRDVVSTESLRSM